MSATTLRAALASLAGLVALVAFAKGEPAARITKVHAEPGSAVELVAATAEDLGTSMRYRATFRNVGKTPLRRLELRWDGWSDTELLYQERTRVQFNVEVDPGDEDDHEWVVFRRKPGVTGYRVRVVRAEHEGAEPWEP